MGEHGCADGPHTQKGGVDWRECSFLLLAADNAEERALVCFSFVTVVDEGGSRPNGPPTDFVIRIPFPTQVTLWGKKTK